MRNKSAAAQCCAIDDAAAPSNHLATALGTQHMGTQHSRQPHHARRAAVLPAMRSRPVGKVFSKVAQDNGALE